MTQRSEVSFNVRHYPNGDPWILIEEFAGNLKIKGFLGLDLPEDTTASQAIEIAEYLDKHVRFLTLTD
jgi:hypothetical protein